MSKQLKNEIEIFNANAGAVVIQNDDQYNVAADQLKTAKAIQKNIDETFDSIIKKAHEAHKEAIGKKKAFANPLIEGMDKIKKVMITYKKKKDAEAAAERRRLDEIAKQQAEDEKIDKALDLTAQGRDDEAEAVINAPTSVAPAAVESAPKVDGVSYRDQWKFEITNPDLIPREYCLPDEKAIGAIARSMKGRIQIPGVRIYNDKIMVAR